MAPRLLIFLALVALLGCNQTAKDHIREATDAAFEKRPQDALLHYRRALDALERDDSPEASVLRARALRGAADLYYLEVRDMRRAVEVYRELIALCPEAPETLEGRLYLAEILRAQFRDLRGAINELTAALARNPPQSAELKYQVAKLYFELGDYPQCDLEAQELSTRYAASAFVDDALFLRAQALGMMEAQRAEAIRAFHELLERFPDSELQPHALFELGKLRAEGGEPEKAIELWVQALRRHPEPSVVQSSIARVRNRLVATTPEGIGDHTRAFDRHRPAVVEQELAMRRQRRALTSVEAAGGTADEAARERDMPREGPEGQAEAQP